VSSRTFFGYPRPDGQIGVRNHILVLPTVVCANGVVERLDREAGTLPLALVTHQHGCGQVGDDLSLTVRTLSGIVANPNVGAVVLVSLGCESNQPQRLAEAAAAAGKPIDVCQIQELGGITATYERVRALAEMLAVDLDRQEREEVPVSELVVGLECGGSDAWSGITANPALGLASDRLVAEGEQSSSPRPPRSSALSICLPSERPIPKWPLAFSPPSPAGRITRTAPTSTFGARSLLRATSPAV
jgi:altronate dehydratase large subunit